MFRKKYKYFIFSSFVCFLRDGARNQYLLRTFYYFYILWTYILAVVCKESYIGFITLLNHPKLTFSGEMLSEPVLALLLTKVFLFFTIKYFHFCVDCNLQFLNLRLFCSEHRCPSTTLDIKHE